MNQALLSELSYQLGRWHAAMEAAELHTCEQSHLRYPWPLDPNCCGCVQQLEKNVRRFHLEVPYRLFGWNAVHDAIARNVQVKINERDARLQMGANI